MNPRLPGSQIKTPRYSSFPAAPFYLGGTRPPRRKGARPRSQGSPAFQPGLRAPRPSPPSPCAARHSSSSVPSRRLCGRGRGERSLPPCGALGKDARTAVWPPVQLPCARAKPAVAGVQDRPRRTGGSRRTEEGAGAAVVSWGCWGEGGGGRKGDGSPGVPGRRTAGLCLGGAAPANGNAAPAEPPWSRRLRALAGGKGRWP